MSQRARMAAARPPLLHQKRAGRTALGAEELQVLGWAQAERERQRRVPNKKGSSERRQRQGLVGVGVGVGAALRLPGLRCWTEATTRSSRRSVDRCGVTNET